jgi:hypothetical protein
MTTFSKMFKRTPKMRIPYLGDEKAPRPYRDWYILVAASLVCLGGLIVGYGYLAITVSHHQVVSSDALIERSLVKIKPGELEKITAQIADQEANFLKLATSSTSAADPSR